MTIITQGNAKTSEGHYASVLLRSKPMGFGLMLEHLCKADRYIVRGTTLADAGADYVQCELYEAEADTPYHTERIAGH